MSDAPRRIQRKRTKGWRMPEGAVYVGRPTQWGNPCMVGVDVNTRAEAVDSFRAFVLQAPNFCEAVRRELRGRDLVCWCTEGQPCHADVLLEIANATEEVTA